MYNVVMRAVITPGIASNLDLIGDRWSLLILRDLFAGRNRFESLQKHTGAGRATLTRRLVSLMEGGVIQKSAYSKARSEYLLTTKGFGLLGSAMLAWEWERQFVSLEAGELPANLTHLPCGLPLKPAAFCGHCGLVLARSDVRLDDKAGTLASQLSSIQSENKQRKRRQTSMGTDGAMTHIAELVGDRWSILLLVSMFFGVARYDEFQRLLGIATNVLGERLNQLIDGDVVEKVPYQDNPVRYKYLLTLRGEALYGFIMSVWQWALTYSESESKLGREYKQENGPEGDVALQHSPCEHSLEVVVCCSNCDKGLKLNYSDLS